MATRYTTKLWHNKPIFECGFCPYSCFDEHSMQEHQKFRHHTPQLFAPLVSCLCVSNRPDFLTAAVRRFYHQTYTQKQLVVVWNGLGPCPALPTYPNLKLVTGPVGSTLGELRNIGVRNCDAKLVIHWDDDDLFPEDRLRQTVDLFWNSGRRLAGIRHPYFYDVRTGEKWQYVATGPGLAGASLAYWKQTWQSVGGFPHQNHGEDTLFSSRFDWEEKLVLPPSLMVATRHGYNTTKDLRVTDPRMFQPASFAVPAETRPASVALGLLTWNTREYSTDSLQAHILEARNLRLLGYKPGLVVVDNGSTDGTPEALQRMLSGYEGKHLLVLNDANRGNCIARNTQLDWAVDNQFEYFLMVDSDIEVIPGSVLGLVRYMEKFPKVGCLGFYSGGFSAERKDCTQFLDNLAEEGMVGTDEVAWTQYGLFRTSMFADGIRFLEEPPFDGPGWGCEDNDLAYQIEVAGWRNQYIVGRTYLHRHIRSSIRNLKKEGADNRTLFENRRSKVIDKWAGVPIINGGALNHLRRAVLSFD